MGRSRLLQQILMLQGQQAIIDAHAAFLVVWRRRRRQKQFRSIWVRRWFSAERKLQYDQYDRLMVELRMEDVHSFFNFLRMQPEIFDELLNRVVLRIQKNDTLWRKSLEPGLKLAMTLRHLAAGDLYPTLHFGFRVTRNTISTFIPELCQAIIEEYKDEVITSKRVLDCVSSLSKVASLCVSCVSRIRLSVDLDIGGTFFFNTAHRIRVIVSSFFFHNNRLALTSSSAAFTKFRCFRLRSHFISDKI